jgi:hypothetical protein
MFSRQQAYPKGIRGTDLSLWLAINHDEIGEHQLTGKLNGQMGTAR